MRLEWVPCKSGDFRCEMSGPGYHAVLPAGMRFRKNVLRRLAIHLHETGLQEDIVKILRKSDCSVDVWVRLADLGNSRLGPNETLEEFWQPLLDAGDVNSWFIYRELVGNSDN